MSPYDANNMASLAGLLVTPAKGADRGNERDRVDDDKDPAVAGKKDETTADDEWLDEGDDTGTPDGTAADPDQGDEDGEAAEADDTVDPTEPLYTVTIDGKPERVTLKEALAGYQRTKDYTRKTEELAARRKAADDEFGVLQKQRGDYDSVLKVLLEKVGPEDQERTPEQWSKLREENPDAYAMEWTDFQRRQEARTALKDERKRVADEQAKDQVKVLQKHVDDQRKLLVARMPEWEDPKEYEAGATRVFAFAKDAYGFSDAELAQAYDHRMVVMAEDARQWREFVARRDKARKQLADAPEVPSPGPRAHAQSRRAVQKEAAQKRFDRSGKVDDAVPLLVKG